MNNTPLQWAIDVSIINQCWSIHAVLGEYRLKKSIAQESKKFRRGRFAEKLRHWLNERM